MRECKRGLSRIKKVKSYDGLISINVIRPAVSKLAIMEVRILSSHRLGNRGLNLSCWLGQTVNFGGNLQFSQACTLWVGRHPKTLALG